MQALDRTDAARLLGVSEDAAPDEVRRAFRAWAALSHPDRGGDGEFFGRLSHARDVRLREPFRVDERQAEPVRPRRPWRAVAVLPGVGACTLLALTWLLAVASVLVAIEFPLVGMAFAACLASAWCVAAARAALSGPDHGHVIVARSVAWSTVVVGQLGVALVAGIPMIEMLPVVAVPFVAVIASVNPGAGLWRSASG